MPIGMKNLTPGQDKISHMPSMQMHTTKRQTITRLVFGGIFWTQVARPSKRDGAAIDSEHGHAALVRRHFSRGRGNF